MGRHGATDFVNAVAQVNTGLPPLELLHHLQDIEAGMGRRRDGRRWGPRVIDLDLLLYGDHCQRGDELELPHPRMHERVFVLAPLAEIDAALVIPGRGAVGDLLAGLDDQGVERIEPAA